MDEIKLTYIIYNKQKEELMFREKTETKNKTNHISINPTAGIEKAMKEHPGLPIRVLLGCVELIDSKMAVNRSLSDYRTRLNSETENLVPVLEETPYINSLGSVLVHKRVSFSFTDEQIEDFKDYCKRNGLRFRDYIEVRTSYNPTPKFRKILLGKSDIHLPVIDTVEKKTKKFLRIKLSE